MFPKYFTRFLVLQLTCHDAPSFCLTWLFLLLLDPKECKRLRARQHAIAIRMYVKPLEPLYLLHQGDSGGPFVCQRRDSCQWFLAGIGSFGPTQCGIGYIPAVFMDVAKYEKWLKEEMAQN